MVTQAALDSLVCYRLTIPTCFTWIDMFLYNTQEFIEWASQSLYQAVLYAWDSIIAVWYTQDTVFHVV
jgi:hypothetical protein